MKKLPFLLPFVLLPVACGKSSSAPPATAPKPIPTNLSPQVREEMRGRLERADPVFHVGCTDEEKGSCQDPRRVCGKEVGKRIVGTLARKEVVIEWEEPRATWMKNEGVQDQYWFVKPDGSGDHYWLLPSPDDVQTVCGDTYCGWHKEALPRGSLVSAAPPPATAPAKGKRKEKKPAGPGKVLHLVPAGGQEIADLAFCPPPPPQPDSYQ